MFKINLSYFPSRARLNFRWIFKEFDLKSNMKGFFENFLALSVKKLKKVLMILSSITGRGRAFLAESFRYMPCLASRRWNFHAKVANPKVNSQKVYHDDCNTLVGECYNFSRECQTSLRGTTKPCANVLDFIDYTTVYNIKVAFAHHFRCHIIHNSTNLTLYSEV